MPSTFGPASPERLADLRARGIVARRERLAVLSAIRDGTVSLADALAAHGPLIEGTQVGTLARRVPGWTARRVHVLLSEIGVEPERRLRGLGRHQRARFLESLGA